MQVHNYMEDLDSSFPCRVLNFPSKIFCLFPCATGSHGKQTCRLLRPSASSLVIHSLYALHMTFAFSKWLHGGIWSWKPLVPQFQFHFFLHHRSLVPEQKGTWCLDRKASAWLLVVCCHVLLLCDGMGFSLHLDLVPELPENLLSRLIVLFLRGLGFCVWRADCSPMSL